LAAQAVGLELEMERPVVDGLPGLAAVGAGALSLNPRRTKLLITTPLAEPIEVCGGAT